MKLWLSIFLLSSTLVASPGTARLVVESDGAAWTLIAERAPLKTVLEEIALRSNLELTILGTAEERITVELRALPLGQVLNQILGGRGFLLRPGSRTEGHAPGSLSVFAPRGEAHDPTPLAGGELDWELPSDFETLTRGDQLETIGEWIERGGPEAAGLLEQLVLADQPPAIREEAIHGLTEISPQTALPILEAALSDPRPDIREAAIEALSEIGGTDATWALALSLRDEETEVRLEAVYALLDLANEVAIELLEQAQVDPSQRVRRAAREALEELGN